MLKSEAENDTSVGLYVKLKELDRTGKATLDDRLEFLKSLKVDPVIDAAMEELYERLHSKSNKSDSD